MTSLHNSFKKEIIPQKRNACGYKVEQGPLPLGSPFKILSHHGVTARSFRSVCGVVGSEPRWLQSVAVSSETDAAVTWMEAVRTSKLK